ncbi:hypothetical protein [Streptomyces sp. NPDC048411]|uniref:hypothetical protein n=1 Tax=Streptomyces sp. NPDC048411 TaxID=3157206 RepID=UPI0034524103
MTAVALLAVVGCSATDDGAGPGTADDNPSASADVPGDAKADSDGTPPPDGTAALHAAVLDRIRQGRGAEAP